MLADMGKIIQKSKNRQPAKYTCQPTVKSGLNKSWGAKKYKDISLGMNVTIKFMYHT